MEKKIELVQSQLIAYNQFDLDGFCACYHPEVKVMLFENDTLIMDGVSEVRAIYGDLFRQHQEQSCELRSRVINNETIIDEVLITGRAAHPEGLKAVVIYAFRDNLIDRVWVA